MIITSLFLTFFKRRWDNLFSHFILCLRWGVRQWSLVCTGAHTHPFNGLVSSLFEHFLGLYFRFNLFNNSSALTPWHRFTFVLVGARSIKCFIEGLKKSVVMHIIDVFHFFLRDSKLIRVLNGSSIYFHTLHNYVLTIHLVEKALL